MQAAILDHRTLRIQEVPVPQPKAEEALVRLTAAGVCHSDLHLMKGDWPAFVSPTPVPLGHEGIGVVQQLGPGAERLARIGDRVIVGLGGSGGGYWCGACEFCLSGRPRLCKDAKVIRGTYAEYISVWVKALVKLPETVKDNDVPLACAGLTAYAAVKKMLKLGTLPGKPVAVIGAAGGLGHYAVQIAKVFGYQVIGVDLGQEKIDFVKRLGADESVSAAEAPEWVKRRYGGVHASLVFSPRISSFALGMKLLRRGGVLVNVGMPPASEGDFAIAPLELLRKDALITSSAVGTVEDMRELVELAAVQKVKTHVSRVGRLVEVPQILADLDAGKYAGRAVVDLGA